MTQVDTNYGKFEVGDVIGGHKYGGQAEITEINTSSIVATTMSTRKTVVITDDVRRQKTGNNRCWCKSWWEMDRYGSDRKSY